MDFSLALSVAEKFDLPKAQVAERISEIKNIVTANWKKLAKRYGLRKSEIEEIAPAFDMRFKE